MNIKYVSLLFLAHCLLVSLCNCAAENPGQNWCREMHTLLLVQHSRTGAHANPALQQIARNLALLRRIKEPLRLKTIQLASNHPYSFHYYTRYFADGEIIWRGSVWPSNASSGEITFPRANSRIDTYTAIYSGRLDDGGDFFYNDSYKLTADQVESLKKCVVRDGQIDFFDIHDNLMNIKPFLLTPTPRPIPY